MPSCPDPRNPLTSHPDTALLLSKRLDALWSELEALKTRAKALSTLWEPEDPRWAEVNDGLHTASLELASASCHLCLMGRGATHELKGYTGN